jgi:hypothetical protein
VQPAAGSCRRIPGGIVEGGVATSMIVSEPPRYGVINARPSVGECIREFSLQEWGTWAGMTVATATYGYAIGNLLHSTRKRGIIVHICCPALFPGDVCALLTPSCSPRPAARPRRVRHPSMVFAGAVGFTGAMCHGIIQAQVPNSNSAAAAAAAAAQRH